MTTMPSASKGPTICSLIDLKVDLSEDVYDHLRRGYKRHYQALGGSEADAEAQAIKHMDRLLDAMKKPPKTSVLRVNTIKSNKEEVISELEKEMNSWLSQFEGARDCMESVVQDSPDFDDVVTIDIVPKDATSSSLYERPGPLPGVSIFSDQPNRQWPLTHRVVVCDRFCGEAVLRGSDIFVRGVLAADAKIRAGEQVAVYADVWHDSKITKRGMLVETYTGRCVFLGMGTSVCKRADFFNSFKGLAVRMSSFPSHRAGPLLPPLSHVLSDKAFLQNLPSILVAHVLDPRPSDIILDMCSAPGGKTSHVASLVQNQATIIACDISRKKMVAAKELFDRLGARITPLAMDSTACVNESETQETVAELLENAPIAQDGLLELPGFSPASFDRILLDPPCSALGLRPKLQVPHTSLRTLQSLVRCQERMVNCAVRLLKSGGTMTYSTCTINVLENEAMVKHILDTYPEMELLKIEHNVGGPGLAGCGLDETQRTFVRRFDPTDNADTMGFFVAKFQKK